MNAPQSLRATVAGYRLGSPAKRAAFGMLSALAVTIAVTRSITYGMERDRNLPRLRSWVRRAHQAIEGGDVRVHHFFPASR